MLKLNSLKLENKEFECTEVCNENFFEINQLKFYQCFRILQIQKKKI